MSGCAARVAAHDVMRGRRRSDDVVDGGVWAFRMVASRLMFDFLFVIGRFSVCLLLSSNALALICQRTSLNHHYSGTARWRCRYSDVIALCHRFDVAPCQDDVGIGVQPSPATSAGRAYIISHVRATKPYSTTEHSFCCESFSRTLAFLRKLDGCWCWSKFNSQLSAGRQHRLRIIR